MVDARKDFCDRLETSPFDPCLGHKAHQDIRDPLLNNCGTRFHFRNSIARLLVGPINTCEPEVKIGLVKLYTISLSTVAFDSSSQQNAKLLGIGLVKMRGNNVFHPGTPQFVGGLRARRERKVFKH